ncbi:5-carboxymethyl-2-hydroxymuconate Delta-isomerase [Bacillus testis]|uniref:5-carboxymethyl-2-hydroxymuconate Delta-isomerase n=1 Tax=Bacillus testis TaxID=1622072 RepID=UPI00067F17AC|nr:5-carboxymethyl-2-hydroxymuconate Delta-isomerase [Bacillus testis]
MPHMIIEYTNNLADDIQIDDLLKKVNKILMAHPAIFPIGGIRSRAIEITHYCIADGSEDDAFVHATLKIGAGRTEDNKKMVCDQLFSMMETHLAPLFSKRYVALSMELYEFNESGTYKKNNIHQRFKSQA